VPPSVASLGLHSGGKLFAPLPDSLPQNKDKNIPVIDKNLSTWRHRLTELSSALLQYPNFTVSYESGIHNVGIFDASIEVFGEDKIVKVNFDTPYVKGLPVTMQIRENTPEGGFKETVVRRTYEDPYTLEMKELYSLVVEGTVPKTTAEDARKDLEIFGMIMKAGV
jgi:predicted dehydrogenase